MDSLETVSQTLVRLVPRDKVVDDLWTNLGLSGEKLQAEVEVEAGFVIITKSVVIDPIAYVLQTGFSGEDSHLRVIVGLGGTENYSGINVPKLCFARLYYNFDLSLKTIDYYTNILG